MSENVTAGEDREALAAEYVLGTLDADERGTAKTLVAEDEAFAAKVKVWERRLGELHLMVDPVEPEPEVWLRIKAKLPPLAPPEPEITPPQIEPESYLEPTAEIEPSPEPSPEPIPEPVVVSGISLEPSSERLAHSDHTPDAGKSYSESDFEREIAELRLGSKVLQTTPETVQEPGESPPPAPRETPLPPEQPEPDRVQGPQGQKFEEQEPQDQEPQDQEPQDQEPQDLDVTADAAGVRPEVEAKNGAVAGVPPEIEAKIAPRPAVSEATTPIPAPERDQKLRSIRRRLSRWRVIAGVLLLAILAVAALPALWKYAPDRVPPKLRPLALMRAVGITIDNASSVPREPAPPESQFDE